MRRLVWFDISVVVISTFSVGLACGLFWATYAALDESAVNGWISVVGLVNAAILVVSFLLSRRLSLRRDG